MNGEPSGLRTPGTAPHGPLTLSLRIHRVLGEDVRQPLRAELRFDPSTPMLVSITFASALGTHVTWQISRELLLYGLYEDSGIGDVQVWPPDHDEPDLICLVLSSQGSSALFELPAAELTAWLDTSYEIVPARSEGDTLDWDGFIAELLHPPEPPA